MKFALRDNIRNRRYYFRMVLIFFIVSYIPALVLSIYYYERASSIITKGLEDSHDQYLMQIAETVDIVIENIIDSAEQMATDELYSEYSAFPKRSYFRTFQNHYNQDEIQRYYEYLELRKRIYNQIELHSFTNEYIHSIYFYDKSEREVFPSDGISHEIDVFSDRGWLSVVQEKKILPYIMEPRYIIDGATKQELLVLTLIYRAFESDSYFIFNIDVEYFYTSMFEKLNWGESVSFFVFSQELSPILFSPSEEDLVNQVSSLIKTDDTPGISEFMLQGTSFQVNNYESTKLNWKFISLLNPTEYYLELNGIQYNVILFTGGILLFIALLILFLGRILYRPIDRLIESLNRDSGVKFVSGKRNEGELGRIQNYVESTRTKNLKLETKLSLSIPAYKEKFLHGLLEGQGGGWNKIIDDMKSFNIQLKPENLVIMMFVVDPTLHTDSEENSASELVSEFLRNMVSDEPVEFISFEQNKGVLILNNEKSDYAQCLSLGNSLVKEIQKQISGYPIMGISTICPSIMNLNQAYLEAEEAILYRMIFGRDKVIPYQEILSDSVNWREDLFPVDIIAAFSESLTQGDEASVLQKISYLFEKLYENRHVLSYNQVQHFYVQILTKIISVTQKQERLFSYSGDQEEDYYVILMGLKNFEIVREWFIEIAGKAARGIAEFHSERDNTYVSEVILILEKEYKENINLNSVADTLNLNPFYVSRLFKNTTGVNFTDYLTDIRINKAKELLLKEKLPIKEIGELVGYDSSNYFIRVFKKKTGKTPGEYKHIHSMENLHDI